MKKSNQNIVYDLNYHVVWCVKYRRRLLEGEIEQRLKKILLETSLDVQAEILEMETDKDHVHLLISCDPQFGIHRVVKRLKGKSSRLLRQEFPSLKSRLPTLWTNSYFVSSVGGASLETVKQYIENQQKA
jgi:putative transposase